MRDTVVIRYSLRTLRDDLRRRRRPAMVRDALPDHFTPGVLAEALGVPANRLYQAINKGELSAVEIGGRRYVDLLKAIEWVQKHYCAPGVQIVVED